MRLWYWLVGYTPILIFLCIHSGHSTNFLCQGQSRFRSKLGVHVLAADYASLYSLVVFLEEHKIDAVISVMNNIDTTPELNLIQAAGRSNATYRFIPNKWTGVDYSES